MRVLTAEAHISETGVHSGPWSIRAELWDQPDESGKAMAWATFLSPEAPAPCADPFDLTLGRTKVAECQLEPLPAEADVPTDNDFLEHPERGLRAA